MRKHITAFALTAVLLVGLLGCVSCKGETDTPTEALPSDAPKAEKTSVTVQTLPLTETVGSATIRISDSVSAIRIGGEMTRDAFKRTYYAAAIQEAGKEIKLQITAENSGYSTLWLQTVAEDMTAACMVQPHVMPLGSGNSTPAIDLLTTGNTNVTVYGSLSAFCANAGTVCAGSSEIAVLYNDGKDNTEDIYPIVHALLSDGIQVRAVRVSDLLQNGVPTDIRVILFADEDTAAFSETQLTALAKWVQDGGTLGFIGGAIKGKNAAASALFDSLQCTVNLEKFTLKTEASPVNQTEWPMQKATAWTVRPRYLAKMCSYVGAQGTAVMYLGEQPLAWQTAVGKGTLLCLGVSKECIAYEPLCQGLLQDFAGYAMDVAGCAYTSAAAFVAQRGSYTLVHTLDHPYTLEGMYLCLQSSEAGVVVNPTVEANQSVLFLQVQSAQDQANGVLYATVDYTQEEQGITLGARRNSVESVLYRFPEGVYPKNVQVTADGEKAFFRTQWSKETRILRVTTAAGVENTKISWSVSDTDTYKDQTITVKNLYVETNERNADRDFIHFCNAGVNSALRFADLSTEIIYRYDLRKYPFATVTLNVLQNYIVEISPDATNWTMIADYSQGGTVPHTRAGNNNAALYVTPDMYGSWTTLYVRIRNSDVTQGWGGSITGFTISYIAEK